LVTWSKFPDVVAVALLTLAFASVARRAKTALSSLWLLGWLMIVLHFAAFLFLSAPDPWSLLASFVCVTALVSAGLLFMSASVPYRKQTSSLLMIVALLATHALYLAILTFAPASPWTLIPPAILLGAVPLFIAIVALPRIHHPLRWTVVCLYCALSIILLFLQAQPDIGPTLAVNALCFTVFLGCCVNFSYTYRRATAGAFITIAGFFTWASVFIVAPLVTAYFPNLHVENEVWNLPKYVVAVGMILLLLEDQIEHNKFLALHDELTGLPNRRLFQDRLLSALERARRTGSHVALMLLDLNDFKLVNDTVGHHVGDELLKHVGNLFTGRVRRSDTVARTGGDEFSIILEEPMTRADADRVGNTLAQLIDSPIELNGHTVRVGASIGIALFPDDALDAESLSIAADRRMYAGKLASRIDKSGDKPRRHFRPSAIPSPKGPEGLQPAE